MKTKLGNDVKSVNIDLHTLSLILIGTDISCSLHGNANGDRRFTMVVKAIRHLAGIPFLCYNSK